MRGEEKADEEGTKDGIVIATHKTTELLVP